METSEEVFEEKILDETVVHVPENVEAVATIDAPTTKEPSTVVTVNMGGPEVTIKKKPKQNLTKKACPYCDREFSRKRVVDKHMLKCKLSPHVDSRDDHVCRHCGKQFSSKWNALRHENLFHTADANIKKYCRYCGNQFDTRDTVMVHEKICPKKLIPQFRKANVIEWIPANPPSEAGESSSESKTVAAISRITPLQSIQNTSNIIQALQKQLAETSGNNESKLKCSYCDKEFSSGGPLKRHQNVCPVVKLLKEAHDRDYGNTKSTNDDEAEDQDNIGREKDTVEMEGEIVQQLRDRVFRQIAKNEGKNYTQSELSTKLTRCIANLLTSELLPLSIIENNHFKELLNIACPSFLIPSHFELFYKILPEMQSKVQDSLKDDFRRAEGPVCATVTIASNWQEKEFVGITTTFITKEGGGLITKDVVITCQVFDGVPESIQKILREQESLFNMPLNTIVSRNCERVRSATEGSFTYVGCMADNLSMVIEEALKKSPEIKDVVRGIVQIHDKYRYRLTHHSCQNYVPTDNYSLRQLMEDTPTRWSYVYNIIAAFTKQKDEFNHLSEIGMMDKIDANMWEALELLEKNLAPFNTATKELCQDYSSIATIIPIIINLRDVLRDISNASEKEVGEMAAMKNFLKDLKECYDRRFLFPLKTGDGTGSSYNYFNDNYEIFLKFLVATTLDPRFKLSLIPGDNLKAECIKIIEEECIKLYQASADHSPPPPKKANVNQSVLFRQNENVNSLTKNEIAAISSIKEAISKYIDTPRISQDASPLEYWCISKADCSWLYNVAVKYLTCPPTSVRGESLINSVFRKNRNQLQYQEHGLVSFLNMNLDKIV